MATTIAERVIVGMDVVNIGSSQAQFAPMVERVEQRLGGSPKSGRSTPASRRTSSCTRWPR